MNRDSIIRRVVAALALGLAVPAAIYQAAQDEGVSVSVADEVVRHAIIDASVVLRSMGRGPDAIAQIVAEQTGAPAADVLPVVRLAVGHAGRDPRSIRSESVTLAVPVADAEVAIAAGADVFCEPLLLGGEPTSIHAECIAANAVPQGTAMCDAQGAVVGYVVRSQATPPQAQRARERLAAWVVDVEPEGWGACAD